MIEYFILLLPFSICYGYAMQMVMRRNKNPLLNTSACLVAALGVYYLCYSYQCNPHSSELALLTAHLVTLWLSAILIPLGLAIMNGLRQRPMFDKEVMTSIIPGFILGVAGVIVHVFGLGEEAHQTICTDTFHIVMGAEMLYFIGSTFIKIGGRDFSWHRLCTFFTKNTASRPLMVIGVSFIVFTLITLVRIILGPDSYTDYFAVGTIRLLFTSFILLLMFNALNLANSPWITLKSLFDLSTHINHEAEEEELLAEEKKDSVIAGPLLSDIPTLSTSESTAVLDQIDRLAVDLQKYMEDEQAFLQPDINIEKVSAHLCTNRFYVSRLVNVERAMTFRDYINTLRINYAKKYMQENQEANQEQIALACGFSSASYFNRKFKQMTGVSPQDWKKK